MGDDNDRMGDYTKYSENMNSDVRRITENKRHSEQVKIYKPRLNLAQVGRGASVHSNEGSSPERSPGSGRTLGASPKVSR